MINLHVFVSHTGDSVSSLQVHTHLLSMTHSQSTLKYTGGEIGFVNDMYPTFQNSYSASRERGFGKLIGEKFLVEIWKDFITSLIYLAFH